MLTAVLRDDYDEHTKDEARRLLAEFAGPADVQPVRDAAGTNVSADLHDRPRPSAAAEPGSCGVSQGDAHQ
ncbi:hypothetical protein [Amycolatopsis sp. NPDC004079]|uniref:hypothetical protein n=1 Tax=Amycolatopsis sp. NPDC004079 TaxID=3154549 RepID=UPI0033AAAD2C